MEINVEDKEVSDHEALQSVEEIMSENELLSMSTTGDREPHINTAFFSYENLRLYIFTPPETVHGQNLEDNPSVAVDIHDSHQEWTDYKKGLQIFGKAELKNSQEILDKYRERFPGMNELAEEVEELGQFDSEFYVITPGKIKIFDEPRFGKENWVNVKVNY